MIKFTYNQILWVLGKIHYKCIYTSIYICISAHTIIHTESEIETANDRHRHRENKYRRKKKVRERER